MDTGNSTDKYQREFYKHRGRPVFKALLIAICTYQVLYWGWAKLESLEVKQEKEGTPPPV